MDLSLKHKDKKKIQELLSHFDFDTLKYSEKYSIRELLNKRRIMIQKQKFISPQHST